MDRDHVNHLFTSLGQKLIVLAQAAVAIEPSQRALHKPPFQQEKEAFGPPGRLTISRRTFRQDRNAHSEEARSPAYA